MDRNQLSVASDVGPTTFGSQIPQGIANAKTAPDFHDVFVQNDALRNQVLANLPAPAFKRLFPFFAQ